MSAVFRGTQLRKPINVLLFELPDILCMWLDLDAQATIIVLGNICGEHALLSFRQEIYLLTWQSKSDYARCRLGCMPLFLIAVPCKAHQESGVTRAALAGDGCLSHLLDWVRACKDPSTRAHNFRSQSQPQPL